MRVNKRHYFNSMNIKNLKTAIVYDWVDSKGGIERVIPLLIKAFKNADLFTSYFDPKKAPWATKYEVKTSFIQKLPYIVKKNRLLSMVFYPYAFESLNLSDYDLVISITSSFSKSVITKPQTKHICYMLTPTRYLWVDKKSYLTNWFLKYGGKLLIPRLKKWDFIASRRPDKIISISKLVQNRVKKYYKRDSFIIYPPFDIEYWSKIKSKLHSDDSNHRNYYLVVSRLEGYKKVELVIEVFNKLKEKLIIVGTGSQENKLHRLANSNIEFKKDISDIELAKLYSRAEALIMPQVEEFGIVSLEAQFFGCPIISYKKSGAAETIIDGKTGIFFNKQDVKSLSATIVRYRPISYNLKKSTKRFGIENLEKFNKEKFIYNFKKAVYL